MGRIRQEFKNILFSLNINNFKLILLIVFLFFVLKIYLTQKNNFS